MFSYYKCHILPIIQLTALLKLLFIIPNITMFIMLVFLEINFSNSFPFFKVYYSHRISVAWFQEMFDKNYIFKCI